MPQPAVESMPGRICIIPDDRTKSFRTEAPDILIVLFNYLERFFYRAPGFRMVGEEIGMIQYGRTTESDGSIDVLLKLILIMRDARKGIIGADVRPNSQPVGRGKTYSFSTLGQTSAPLI